MLFVVALLYSLFLLNGSINGASKYGGWDAWYIWDFHARYMMAPGTWQNLLTNMDGAHPDYPPALSGLLAFFKRLYNQDNLWVINFGIHYFIMLLIPVLIFAETYKRSIVFSILALVLIATNHCYTTEALSQFADTLLAFFFLAAIICIDNSEHDKRMMVAAGAFIGLCMWTKNEGVILAVLFVLFHAGDIFRNKQARYFTAGIALPLIAFLVFKLIYSPDNHMIRDQGYRTYPMIYDLDRYKMIYHSFVENYSESFRAIKYGIAIYLLLIVIRKQWPQKQIVMVATICLVYMLIYVVTPHNLSWHLFTSQKRLMHQLMPAMIYLLAKVFSGNGGTTIRLINFSRQGHRQ